MFYAPYFLDINIFGTLNLYIFILFPAENLPLEINYNINDTLLTKYYLELFYNRLTTEIFN